MPLESHIKSSLNVYSKIVSDMESTIVNQWRDNFFVSYIAQFDAM